MCTACSHMVSLCHGASSPGRITRQDLSSHNMGWQQWGGSLWRNNSWATLLCWGVCSAAVCASQRGGEREKRWTLCSEVEPEQPESPVVVWCLKTPKDTFGSPKIASGWGKALGSARFYLPSAEFQGSGLLAVPTGISLLISTDDTWDQQENKTQTWSGLSRFLRTEGYWTETEQLRLQHSQSQIFHLSN